MHSTNYVVVFVVAMTTIVALVLATLFSVWKVKSAENEAVFNKRSILSSIESHMGGENFDLDDLSDEDVLKIFNDQVEQISLNSSGEVITSDAIVASGYKKGRAEDIDMAKEKKKDLKERIYPMYVFNAPKEKFYILSLRGNGLWDEIWGNVALKEDMNTVAGASFDHRGETPGLGAEIKDNSAFPAMFENTQIYNEKGEYVSIIVRKGGAKNKKHEVDGISGATITGDGVSKMLQTGIKIYEPYLKKVKANKSGKPIGMN